MISVLRALVVVVHLFSLLFFLWVWTTEFHSEVEAASVRPNFFSFNRSYLAPILRDTLR